MYQLGRVANVRVILLGDWSKPMQRTRSGRGVGTPPISSSAHASSPRVRLAAGIVAAPHRVVDVDVQQIDVGEAPARIRQPLLPLCGPESFSAFGLAGDYFRRVIPALAASWAEQNC
jgi:hypothetical protein